ncbi:MAG: 5'-nucleotidase C-terminal domain-containing protein [Paludibacteraceae bacterium]|nr:5'-nucleotidase C-terminal domain-containing protein [Paludibacteraceae bacterium]
MKKVYLLIILCVLVCACVRKPMQVTNISGEVLLVDQSIDAIQDTAYVHYLAPIKANMEEQLSAILGYAPEDMVRSFPECNLLNWACDALYSMAGLHYVDTPIDLAVVNAGGLRCDWPKGNITLRSVYELMPFDNELVILTLSGEELLLLAQNCADLGGQGVSKQFRVKGKLGVVEQVSLNGKPIDPKATYHVATSDYLSGGADGLSALTHFTQRVQTGQKMRDLYIDYIKLATENGSAVAAEVDGRMQIEIPLH